MTPASAFVSRGLAYSILGTLVFMCIYVVVTLFSFFLFPAASLHQAVGEWRDTDRPWLEFPGEGYDPNQLSWFMQVSDLHISVYHPDRSDALERFVRNDVIKVIKPSMVFVSGDLVDAKDEYGLTSAQREEEWADYHRILHSHGLLNHDPKLPVWVDIRGNHDSFNVATRTSPLHQRYSVSASSSYVYTHRTTSTVIRFVTADFCPNPGPSRPQNFFGHMAEWQVNDFERRLFDESAPEASATIVFGHYPLVTTTEERRGLGQPSIKEMMAKANVDIYMSGHLHTLAFGLGERMYSQHRDGLWELEVGDFMEHRIYRVMAFDHDQFSFVDTTLDSFPLVLPTFPRDAAFQLRSDVNHKFRRPVSDHIRVLVWTREGKDAHVQAAVDGVVIVDRMERQCTEPHPGTQSCPLYTGKWNPSLYRTGLHELTVTVVDTGTVYHQYFSFDGTAVRPGRVASFLLLTDWQGWLQWLIYGPIVVSIFILVSIPVAYTLSFSGAADYETWRNQVKWLLIANDGDVDGTATRYLGAMDKVVVYVCHTYVIVMYAVCETWRVSKAMSVLLSLIGLYLAYGPLFVGQFLADKLGTCYATGIDIDGQFLPLVDSQIFLMPRVVFLYLPTVLYTILAHLGEHHVTQVARDRVCRRHPSHRGPVLKVLVVAMVLFQVYLNKYLYTVYGLRSIIYSPGSSWLLVVCTGIICFYMSNRHVTNPHVISRDDDDFSSKSHV